MKIKSNSLSEGIKNIVKILGKKISNGIKFNENYIIASKDNITVKVFIKMRTNMPFVMSMDIAMMISNIAEECLSIQNSENEIQIKTSKQVYRFALVSPKQENENSIFIQDDLKEITKLPFEELKRKVSAVLPVSEYSYKTKIGGVMLIGDGQKVNVIGTNSVCLGLYKITCNEHFRICFDKRIKKIFKLNHNGDITLYKNEYSMAFNIDNCTVYVPSIDTIYPNVSEFAQTSKFLSVSRKQMLEAVSRLLQISSIPVIIKADNQSLIMSVKSKENKFFERVEIENGDNTLSVSLNPRYLKIIFKELKDEVIKVGFNINGKFVTFSDENGMWALAIVKNGRV